MADRDDSRRPPARARLRPRGGGKGGSGARSGAAGGAPGAAPRRTPKLTGRSAVLVLVVAVLAVSYASSMRAYLDQRAHIGDLKAEIAQRQDSIADLRRERERWDDPAYAEQQARERFGYVMPGDTSYVVLDEDGEPLEPESGLGDEPTVEPDADLAWWDRAWSSVEVAGKRQQDPELPATRVGAGQ